MRKLFNKLHRILSGALIFGAMLLAVPGERAHAQKESANKYDSMNLPALIAAAKSEKSVTVYSFTSRIARVEKDFELAYPGIDMIPFDISSTEQIARIKAEQQAGIFKVDVAYISDPPVVLGELVQKEFLERYIPPAFAARIPAQFQSPLLAHRLSTKVLMYNEDTHPTGPPLQNLWELTTAKWRGKILTVDPLARGDYLDLMTEIVLRSDEMTAAYQSLFGKAIQLQSGIKSAGFQWIRDLFSNGLVLLKNTDAVNAAVGKIGQAAPPVGLTTYSDRRDNKKNGWALQIHNQVVPSPGILFPAYLGILKNAPHPAAARLLIHFMLGDESPTGGAAFAPFYVPGDYATRSDITPHSEAIPLAQLRAWRIDPAKTFARRQEVADVILRLK